ncbi:MAG: efflux RND transporter periplasmic adaptor subunit [Thiothrix sp.]|nr:MAG: efflux RND transporter periplasmic adaptor subunit [Thiothrix sp.]
MIAKIRSKNQQAGVQQAKAGISEATAGANQAKASLGQAQAGLSEAKAGLSQAKAEEQRAQAASQQANANFQQAQAGVQEAQALLKEAQADFGRISEIYTRRLIPRADYDRSEAALSTAKARVNSAQAQAAAAQAQAESAKAQIASARSLVEAASARVGSADAALAAASATVDASKANQEAAKAQATQATEVLGYTSLVAPYSGIVTQRHVQVGETVNIGTPIMTGISLDQLRVVVEVPQRMINQVRARGKAVVQADDSFEYLPVKSMTIFPYADPKTNAFQVRLNLQEGQDKLYPGMFVKVGFVMGDSKGLVIPKQAVAIRSEVIGVYVINEQGLPSLRQIRLGKEVDSQQVKVLAGLSPHEQIALDPVQAAIYLKKQREHTLNEGESHD